MIHPIPVPYNVLMYQTDLITQVPDRQPINFQYRNPPRAPVKEKIIINRFFLMNSFITIFDAKFVA